MDINHSSRGSDTLGFNETLTDIFYFSLLKMSFIQRSPFGFHRIFFTMKTIILLMACGIPFFLDQVFTFLFTEIRTVFIITNNLMITSLSCHFITSFIEFSRIYTLLSYLL